VAALSLVKQAAARRKKVFTQAKAPLLNEVIDGRVTILRPLKLGDFGIVFTHKGLRIGQVVALYSKTGGKNSKHESVSDSSNICAVSNVAVQLFEYMHGRQFRSIPEATSIFQTKQFALLGSNAFLCLLSLPPRSTVPGLELSQEDADRFKNLLMHEDKFKEAMRLFRKRGQGKEVQEDEEET